MDAEFLRAYRVTELLMELGKVPQTHVERLILIFRAVSILQPGTHTSRGGLRRELRDAFRASHVSGGPDTPPKAVEAGSGDESDPRRTCAACALNDECSLTVSACTRFKPKSAPASEPAERIVAIPASEGFADFRKEMAAERESEPERRCGDCATFQPAKCINPQRKLWPERGENHPRKWLACPAFAPTQKADRRKRLCGDCARFGRPHCVHGMRKPGDDAGHCLDFMPTDRRRRVSDRRLRVDDRRKAES